MKVFQGVCQALKSPRGAWRPGEETGEGERVNGNKFCLKNGVLSGNASHFKMLHVLKWLHHLQTLILPQEGGIASGFPPYATS